MKNFKLTDAYFSNSLTEKEKAEFEQKYQMNPSSKSDVENYKISKQVIELLIQKDLKEKLKNLEKEIWNGSHSSDNEPLPVPAHLSGAHDNTVSIATEYIAPVIRHRNKISKLVSGFKLSKLMVAASSLVLVLAVSFIWTREASNRYLSDISNEQIVFQNFQQYRSSASNHQALQRIESFERAGKFELANQEINNLIGTNPHELNNLQFFRAQNSFRLGDFDEAQQDLNSVIAKKDWRYIEKARLLKVFIAIEKKDIHTAQEMIRELKSEPGYSLKSKVIELEKSMLKK